MKGYVPTPDAVVDAMVSKLFAARQPRAGDVLLDPGCGEGAFLLGVVRHCKAKRLPVPKLVGVETHSDRVAAARRKLGRHAEILQADYLEATLPTATFVLGNPPYVSLPGLDEAERKAYRAKFDTASGRFDLYALFFERSLQLLATDGVLVFITPEKYQYVEAAAELRRLLVERGVDEIHFQDENLFPGRVTYPVITTVAGGKRTRLRGRGRARNLELPRDGSSWNAVINDAAAPRKGDATLESISVRISPGIASGCEEVFVVKEGQVQRDILKHAHKTISGRQLLTTGTSDTKEYLLCPYDDEGRLLPEDKIQKLIAYLGQKPNKDKLVKRTCVAAGRKWYQYHDTFPGRGILQPKILCKDITAEPRFWLDKEGAIVPRHSVYYIVPKPGVDIEKLYDYLNKPRARQWLKDHSQRASRGFYRLQSSVMRNLPVPAELAP
jgi:adenine-specific DNA-methyltransferase